jgi:metal-responsive CopG/Arc/MetJ family transcriptional regulator
VLTTIEKPKQKARVAGVSFSPDIWDYLNAEVERQGHRNRSLVIENAIKVYRAIEEAKRQGESQNGAAS